MVVGHALTHDPQDGGRLGRRCRRGDVGAPCLDGAHAAQATRQEGSQNPSTLWGEPATIHTGSLSKRQRYAPWRLPFPVSFLPLPWLRSAMPSPQGLRRWAAPLLVAGALSRGMAIPAAAGPPTTPLTLTFAGQTYLLRWSSQHQHEFTPAGQDDLSRWTDMVTINTYPGVSDGEGLADVANRALGNYRRHGATVLRTASVPRTPGRPAEHLVVALFPTRAFSEAVFARWRLADGRGIAVIVSHRRYGPKAGDAMAAWLKAKRATVERQLTALDQVPSHRVLEQASP